MIKVGIIGDDPEASCELLRILINHPDVDIVFVDSEEYDGRKLYDVYKGFYGDTELSFTDKSSLDLIDVLFCCNTAGNTKNFMRESSIPQSLKIIDLSPDFRISSDDNPFVYGLPELNRRATCSSMYVSNPGPVATCVSLALLPLARNLLLNNDIVVNVIAGESCFEGPGYTRGMLSVVSPFVHEELPEIRQSLNKLQNSFAAEISMVPVKASFARGVMATVLTDVNVDIDELKEIYRKYYEEDSFTYLVDNLSLDYVLNTNKCFIKLDKYGERLLVTCCIDNMIKGCAGQAIHNMNLLFNLEETTGLTFCPSRF